MGSTKFANINSYPVILPGPRGGSRMFRPGEFTTETWFSRFQGKSQLTKVAADYKPSSKARPPKGLIRTPNFGRTPPPPPRAPAGACASACQTGCQNSCELACESTKQQVIVREHHEQVGGSFYCRYCDWSTMERTKVGPHTRNYHPGKVKATGPGEERGPATTTAPRGGPRASGARAPRPPGGKSAVPRQAPVPSGSRNADEETKWWFRKDGELLCKTCEVAGLGWKTTHRDAMDRHCVRYHDMPQEKASTMQPPPNIDPLAGKSPKEIEAALEATKEEDHKNRSLAATDHMCPDCERNFRTSGGLKTHQRYCKAVRSSV